ncbi:MAG TPA: HEAT repeat domain-containing protein [Kofleriaceae bacterium]|jgi:HEAT repeat protein|nr:HEAT repeat domain-containing protein [Kofleriaceae bacterium]
MRDAIQRTLALIALAFALVLHAAPALADDVDDLAKTMSSSSEKARISAVASLARLEDKRALKPLVTALRDPSVKVRTIACVGLGKLKHKASFAALKNTASDDTDDTVRDKARDAMIAVAKANDMMDSLPADAQPAPVATMSKAKHTKGFGHNAHAVEARPDLYVLVKSSSDDSPGKADKFTRKSNGDIIKQALLDSFKSAPQVTLAATDAQRWGLDPREIDLSVTHLDVSDADGIVEIDAELRLAISDESGKMLSFVSGGAKVQVPSAKFNARFLPQFRKQALEGAMQGLFDKLLDHLRQTTQS